VAAPGSSCDGFHPTAYAAIYLGARSLRRQELLLDALADGVTSLHDSDYSVSIAEPTDDARLRRLVVAYNGLGTPCGRSARTSTSASCCSTR
jgi:hypothetical protein